MLKMKAVSVLLKNVAVLLEHDDIAMSSTTRSDRAVTRLLGVFWHAEHDGDVRFA